MRLMCNLLGCSPADFPACTRCHSDVYSAEFVQRGRFEPLLNTLHVMMHTVSLRHFRCAHCGRFLSPTRLWHELRLSRKWGNLFSVKFCSDDCDDSYFPF